MSDPALRFEVHHYVHFQDSGPDAAQWEKIMNRFEAKLKKLQTTVERVEKSVDSAKLRVAEDIAELKRRIDEGTATEEQVAQFNLLAERLHNAALELDSLDPIPDFPAAPVDNSGFVDEGSEPVEDGPGLEDPIEDVGSDLEDDDFEDDFGSGPDDEIDLV